jgi:hypothetical protein
VATLARAWEAAPRTHALASVATKALPEPERRESSNMDRDESLFELVRKLALKLPDIEESTIHGAPSWKLRGKLLACQAIHKSAEPNSLMIKIDAEKRAELLLTMSDIYYVTDHYRSNSVVLVRLAKIDRRSLQTRLEQAWKFLSGLVR